MLEVRGLRRVYGDVGGTVALDGVDLVVGAGEFVGVMGPSGSGKSSLLGVLAGIDEADGGEVLVGGRGMAGLSVDERALLRRRELGIVFQDFNLLDGLTVRENLLLPMALEGVAEQVMEDRVRMYLGLFGLDGLEGKYPYLLSGGQQQRVAVCRALMNEPAVLLADEPTGNLDSGSSRVVMECFKKVSEELSTTVVLVTHDVFAASYCDRVVFLKDGKVESFIQKAGDQGAFLDEILAQQRRVNG